MSGLVRSALDCRRFGVETYRLTIERDADVRVAVEDDVADLIVARVRTDSIAHVQALEHAGFFLTDTLVYFRGDTASFDSVGRIDGLAVRDADAADRDSLETAARVAFANFYGHYHADPHLDSRAATEGYVEWCVSALDWTDGFVLVAMDGETVAGFATVRVQDGDGEIVLNGVRPGYRRRGIYSALVRTIGHRLREAGVERIHSSTQIQNLGPQKTWARAGLLPAESFFTLHRWGSNDIGADDRTNTP